MAAVSAVPTVIQQSSRVTLLRYGWFTGLMCTGSCAGLLSWSANVPSRVSYFEFASVRFGSSLAERSSYPYLSREAELRSLIAFDTGALVFSSRAPSAAAPHINHRFPHVAARYVVEFMCLSSSKLLIIDRLVEFSVCQRCCQPVLLCCSFKSPFFLVSFLKNIERHAPHGC